ncbi:PucR family transcriptional regulator [Salirhabdus sp. Marseille-P4669]|uniref:PucR family transcriptional regulator n=1 Tax=Salirhabdus sp. Marseille-P4669 TaxID=2042310 RepID=UPI000C7E8410|nr:PucR family transcriptional regulator [Salirhabdus sp. Marseille-P4669]
MRLTMKEVVELPLIREGKLVTSVDCLSESIVEWVSVMETPVENFVRKNEFVLSTGIGCSHDENVFCQFVEEVIASEAAGLAMAIGRYIHEIPHTVKRLAENHQFPIIVLPWEVRFADVVQVVMQALKREEERILKRNEKIQQELLHVILQNGDLFDIADYLYQTIEKPIIITDMRGRIKGKSKKAEKLTHTWNDYLKSVDYDPFYSVYDGVSLTAASNAQVIHSKENSMMQFLVHSASEVQGFLLVDDFNQEKLESLEGEKTIQLLEHGVTAIALSFLKENSIVETEMKLRDDFVWSLAKEKLTSWDEMLSRAKTLNYQINLPFVCLIGCPENLREIFHKKSIGTSFEQWTQTITRRIEDEIYYSGKALDAHLLFTFQRDHFIVYLEVKHDNVREMTDQFYSQFRTRLQQLIPDLVVSWGISKTAGSQMFNISYQEAQKALEIGRRQKGIGRIHMYSDTRLDRALMALTESNDLKEITEQTLSSLLEYDKERGIDLVHTFVTYSRNKGNVSQTARELNLHRQSLLYRLKKIEKLTDCSLDNPDEVFLIELSIRLWMIGNIG